MGIDWLEDRAGRRRTHFGIAEGVLVLLEKVNERRFAVGAAVLQRSEAVRGCLEKMAASRGGRHVGVIRTGGFLAFERFGRELGKGGMTYRTQFDLIGDLGGVEEVLGSFDVLSELGRRVVWELGLALGRHFEGLLVAVQVFAPDSRHFSEQLVPALPLAFVDLAGLLDVEYELAELPLWLVVGRSGREARGHCEAVVVGGGGGERGLGRHHVQSSGRGLLVRRGELAQFGSFRRVLRVLGGAHALAPRDAELCSFFQLEG